MITEEAIESTLHAIRICDVPTARELLRQFAADCRARGLVDCALLMQKQRDKEPE